MPAAARHTAQTAAARPGPRPGYSREEIVECALRLMDREGAEALSFRAVARELDMSVGALSRYFPNLADLQDEVAAKMMGGLRPLEVRNRRELPASLAKLGTDMVEITHAHPYLVRIHGPASAAVITRLTADAIRTLMRHGVDANRALMLMSVVMNLAQAWGQRDAVPRSPERHAAIVAAGTAAFGDLLPVLMEASGNVDFSTRYREWLIQCINGLLK